MSESLVLSTRSNSSWISAEGSLVKRLTTTIVIVSLCTKEPSAEIQLEFDRVESTRLSDIKL